MEYKDTEHVCTCVKQTLERKWHCEFKYKESFEWGVSIGSGSKKEMNQPVQLASLLEAVTTGKLLVQMCDRFQ